MDKSSIVSTKVTNFFCINSRLNFTKFCTIAVLANNRFKTLDDYHADDGKTEVRCLLHTEVVYTVKKVIVFPVPSWDVTNQTLPGRKLFNYSRPGRVRVWLVTSRLGQEIQQPFFTLYDSSIHNILVNNKTNMKQFLLIFIPSRI